MDESIYKQHILEHAQHPHNKAEMEYPSVSLPAKNSTCGDSYIVYLEIDGDIIKQASFSGVGCAISVAAASMLTSKLTGLTLEEARAISKEDVFDMLGIELSLNRQKCGLLVWNGFQDALKQYENA
jgi:nitrogen fixation NifU-like protein